MKYIPLEKLNETIFRDAPVPLRKLQRWCRKGDLPARKIGGEWFIDLDEFGRPKTIGKPEISGHVRLVIDRLNAIR